MSVLLAPNQLTNDY